MYLAYGLCIQSDLPLPELTEVSTSPTDPATLVPDVKICLTASTRQSPVATPTICVTDGIEGTRADCIWPGVGEFTVRRGAHVEVTPEYPLNPDTVRLFLLGPVIAVVLHQRGWLLLHASAVDIGGRAVAFLGPSGQGKSSTVAALTDRGHRLIADDVVAIPQAKPGCAAYVIPAFPQIKLWPDSATAITGVTTLPRLRADAEKRAHQVRGRFTASPVPLSGLYVLDPVPPDAPHTIASVSPSAALLDIIRHGYGAHTLAHSEPVRRFTQAGALATTVPLYHLRVRRGFAYLPELATLVEHHALAGLSNAPQADANALIP